MSKNTPALPLDQTIAENVLSRVARDNAIDATDQKLMRLGSNAVFILPRASLVIRIHRPTQDMAAVVREVEIADYLVARGVPCVAPAHQFESPVQECDGYVISLWEYVAEDPSRFDAYGQFGELVRRFHEAITRYDVALPGSDINRKIQKRIETLVAGDLVSAEEQDFLETQQREIASQVTQFHSTLGQGVIHGDMHSGNLVNNAEAIRLCDFENVAIGYREWDLIPTLVNARRFSLRDGTFEDFMAGYRGSDTGPIDLEPFCQAKELSMVTWLLQNRYISDDHAREADHRLATLIQGTKTKWHAF